LRVAAAEPAGLLGPVSPGSLARAARQPVFVRAFRRDDGPEEAVVFVHDGVRCLLSVELVRSCYEQAIRLGSAIPVVDSKDSVRVVSGEESVSVDRSRVKLVQTPQTFLSSVLLSAYSQPYQESFTDEASVVEANGGKVFLLDGEIANIKITTPVDLVIAEHHLKFKVS